jgi:prepilin peptidase CpaA
VFNITRGLWLGAILQGQEQPVWVCPASPLWGALDGFLFALAGFALSFGLFLALWILGMAGGGDVKLLAALGAWVGPYYFFLIFLGTGGVLVLVSLFAVLRKMSRRGVQRTIFGGPVRSTAKTGRQLPVGAQARHRLITYSLPVALSTAVLFPLFFHADLGWQLPNLSGAPTRFSAQP